MSNYYVRRTNKYDDELAHSLGGWLKRRAQGAHKYIAKIPIGGKMRYFYTQAELAAYKAGKTVGKAATNVKNRLTVTGAQGRYTVKRIGADAKAAAGRAGKLVTGAGKKVRSTATGLANEVANRTGLTARSQRDNAANPLERYHAQKRYDRTPLGTAEVAIRGAGRRAGELAGRARNAAEDAAGRAKGAAGDAVGSVRKTARKAGTAVANATGYSERQRAKRLESYADQSMKRFRDTFGSSSSLRDYHRRQVNAENALNAASQARKSYNKTAMGRAEGAARRAGSAVSDTAERVSGAAKTVRNAVAGTARKVGSAATKTAKRAGTAVANATGYSARKKSNSAPSRSMRNRAQAQYNSSPMGRVENAVKSAPGRMASTASGAANDWRKKRYLKRQSKKGANA